MVGKPFIECQLEMLPGPARMLKWLLLKIIDSKLTFSCFLLAYSYKLLFSSLRRLLTTEKPSTIQQSLADLLRELLHVKDLHFDPLLDSVFYLRFVYHRLRFLTPVDRLGIPVWDLSALKVSHWNGAVGDHPCPLWACSHPNGFEALPN